MRPPYDICTVESGCLADMQTLGYHVVRAFYVVRKER
jgi:hypothetical protein